MKAGPPRVRRALVPALGGPGRPEALLALARACVLLFSAASLALAEAAPTRGLVVAHVVAGVLSAAAALPLGRLRTPRAAARAAVALTGADVLAFAAYSIAVDGRPGLGSLYPLFVVLVGPLRWRLRGVLATGIPVALIASIWPIPDAGGQAPSGLVLWLLVAAITIPVAGVAAVWQRSAARLRQAHEQFEAAFEHASIGMALLSANRTVLQANPSLAALLGVGVRDLVGTGFEAWAAEEDRAALNEALLTLSPARQAIRVEVRFRRPDGEHRWGLVAASLLTGSAGVPPRVVAQVENVHDRKSAEARLSHLAQHDVLTALPNRSLLHAHLEQALGTERGACVVFLDLDRFKVVNDGLGHAAGDVLLQQVAARLRALMRPGDLVARLGGDEFVVLCHGVRRHDEAQAVAERVLAALRAPVRLDARSEVSTTASAGIVLVTPGCTAETLLRDADVAMYAAKSAGGDRAHVFTPDLHQAALRTHELESDLRRALAQGRLELAYQPIVDLTTGQVTELEALVRWKDHSRGRVSPQEFVAVAEQSSLIIELGAWVLDRALHDAARWPAGTRAAAPAVAVNVSPRQLLDPMFADVVAQALREHEVAPQRLCLEVTETALVEDPRELVPALRVLRGLGVRLAIDDFGTGHASLTYLAQLPVDVVKVDRSFVVGVAEDVGSAGIVGGVVAMAGAFGMTVVAEGVETTEQLHRLRRLGVHAVQGYLLAQPMWDKAVQGVLSAPPVRALPVQRGTPAIESLTEIDTAQRFRVLLDAARDVTACVDLDGVLATAFAALRQLLDFTGGSIQLVDGDVVRLAATDPPATPEAMAATMPVGTGVSGGIAANGEPRYLPDITIAASVSASSRSTSTSAGVRSWYGVPLVAEGRIVGVLQIDSTVPDAFTDGDRLLVLSFASVVAAAVQTVRLFADELHALQRPPA